MLPGNALEDQTGLQARDPSASLRNPSLHQSCVDRRRDDSRLVSYSTRAGNRRACPPSTARRLRSEALSPSAHPSRSALLGCPFPFLTPMESLSRHRRARDRSPMASRRIPKLLAFDLAFDLAARNRTASDFPSGPGPDPPACQRKSLACAENPGGAREIGILREPGDRIALLAEARKQRGTASAMDDVPSEPSRCQLRDGFPGRSHSSLQAALRVVCCFARAPRALAFQRDGTPNATLGHSANSRDLPRRDLDQVSDPRRRFHLLGSRGRDDRASRDHARANFIGQPVAERDCRTIGRDRPTRVARSRRRDGRTTFTPPAPRLRRVLQRGSRPYLSPRLAGQTPNRAQVVFRSSSDRPFAGRRPSSSTRVARFGLAIRGESTI